MAVAVLPSSRGFEKERILPTQTVPTSDVKCEGKDVTRLFDISGKRSQVDRMNTPER
jgi:hypothetical protein